VEKVSMKKRTQEAKRLPFNNKGLASDGEI
jgi:hypothetical protein